MRCAVSFLTVVGLSIGVGVMALYIIWMTENEEFCPVDDLRCTIDGKCIKPQQVCNGIHDCSDASDEAPIRCNDLTTTKEMLGILTACMKGVDHMSIGNDTNEVEDLGIILKPSGNEVEDLGIIRKPNGCEFLYPSKNDTAARGVKCANASALEWTSIPWSQFDEDVRTISIDSGVVNTTLLQGLQDWSVVEFPQLDKVYIFDNYIESLEAKAFCHMESICWFVLENNSIRNLNSSSFCEMPRLNVLKMSGNKLHLKDFQFSGMPKLGILHLDNNEIVNVEQDTFQLLHNLKMLNLSHNKIKTIHEKAFLNNTQLIELDLTYNQLHHLSSGSFQRQTNLKKLYISNNRIEYLQAKVFEPLGVLRSLNIEDLDISRIDINIFKRTPVLDLVYFKKFSYCKFVPWATRCFPNSDGLSSTSNLLLGQSRIMVWLIGMLTLIGNLFVLANRWLRRHSSRNEIANIFVCNLACADFLMGVYLIILACKDVQFRGLYNVKAYEWGTSWLCSVIGIIAMISSEASLLILMILSLERFLVIGGPFSQHQNLNSKLARACMLIIWIFVAILALAPAVHWQGNSSFYGSSGLCFPLHLDERFAVGWQYTTFVFIGLNLCCLILITICYSMLFYTVRQTQRNTPLIIKNSELKLATRFFLMVITDVICWAPLICLKIAVHNGHELPKEIIGWMVIYVLPINSAVNPILYTFSTDEVRSALISNVQRLFQTLFITDLVSTPTFAGSVEMRSAGNGCNSPEPDQPVTATDDTQVTHSTCPLTPNGPQKHSENICRINNPIGCKKIGSGLSNKSLLNVNDKVPIKS